MSVLPFAAWSRDEIIRYLSHCVYPKHRGRYAQMFEARLRELPDDNLRRMAENAMEEAQAREELRLKRRARKIERATNGGPR